jgi:pyruvate,orthophosphate dikinase
VQRFKSLIRARIGRDFPTDPWEQLWGAVFAVFESWNNDRAKVYRELNDIPQSWGTAVNVQAMVFGNLGDSSATGVAFSRDAGTGEDLFNGEFLINAQGEDVVAGIRTPQQISRLGSQRWAQLALVNEEERRSQYPSLEELMPDIYQQLLKAETLLENHFRTCRTWSSPSRRASSGCCRPATASARAQPWCASPMEMLKQGMIDEKTALLRVAPDRLNELLHPVFDTHASRPPRSSRAACRPRRARRPGRSCSLPTKPRSGSSKARW